MTQTLVRGYDVIYPEGCKEVSDDLRADDLRKRLKDIWKALLNIAESPELSQEDSLLNSSQPGPSFPDFRGLAFYLSSEQFTEHSDADIRLRVACCLCAIIKLYCPDTPFDGITDAEGLLRRVLNLFTQCIRLLGDLKSKESAHFMPLFALFSTCCQVDVFVWCGNLSDGSDILLEVFRTVFHIIKNVEVWAWTDAVKVKHLVLDMLSNLLVQNENILNHETVVFLLRFLMEPAKSAQPQQNELARDLILRNGSHIEYWIHMIIQGALLNAESARPLNAPISADDASEKPPGEGSGPGAELGDHVYLLIYELHTLQDSLIKPILPSLVVKLKSNEIKNRKRCVRLLAKFFGEAESTLHRLQPALWEAFVGRFTDIEAPVRELCIRLVPQMVRSNPDLAEPLLGAVGERAKDLQESVRELAVKVVGEMLKDCPSSSRPRQLMEILVDRARDKVTSIRKEAAGHLASMYRRMITQGTLAESNWDQGVSILNTIMHLYYVERVEDKVSVERLFKSSLVPYTLSSEDRMKSLLRCYCALDEHSIKVFNEMLKTQFFLLTLQRQILQILTENQGKKISGDTNGLLVDKLAKLAAHLQNSDKSLDFLKRFFNHVHEDRSLRHLMVKMTAADCPCSKATEYLKEILRRVNLPVSRGGSGGSANDAYQTCIRVLLERTAPVLFDQEAAQELVTLLVVVRESPDAILDAGEPVQVDAGKGLNLLLALSVYMKEIFFAVDDLVDYLLTTLDSAPLSAVGGGQEDVRTVSLHILHNLCAGGMFAPGSPDTAERFEGVQEQLLPVLKQHAVPTSPPPAQRARQGARHAEAAVTELLATRRRAKFAVLALHALTNGAGTSGDSEEEPQPRQEVQACLGAVVEQCSGAPDQVGALCALGHVALLMPQAFAPKLKLLVSRELIPKVVMKDPAEATPGSKEPLATWLPDTQVSSFTWLRIEALKLMTRWLVGLQTDDRELVCAVVKLLYTVILGQGDLTRKGRVRAGEMSRLRLAAAKCWLKLAQQRCYVDVVETAWFHTMARVITDPCEEVRSSFLRKLHRGLISLRLPLEYLGIFALSPMIGDPQFRAAAKAHLASNVQARKDFLARNKVFLANPKKLYAILPDYVLPYALHLLAHDPDWKKTDDADFLNKMKSCLAFLLEPIVVKSDNFSFLRKMLEKMKHAKDAFSPNDAEANAKLYSLCDLALGLVMSKSSHLVLKEYPVEPALPSRLFVRAERGFVNPEFGSLPQGPVRFSPPKGAGQGLIPPGLLKRKAGTAGTSARPDENRPKAANHGGKPAVPTSMNGRPRPNVPAKLYPKAKAAGAEAKTVRSPVKADDGPRKRSLAEDSPRPPIRVLTGPEESESEPEDVVRFTPTKKPRLSSPGKLKPRGDASDKGSPAKSSPAASPAKGSGAKTNVAKAAATKSPGRTPSTQKNSAQSPANSKASSGRSSPKKQVALTFVEHPGSPVSSPPPNKRRSVAKSPGSSPTGTAGKKRGRGRPPLRRKEKDEDEKEEVEVEEEAKVVRKAGRPAKNSGVKETKKASLKDKENAVSEELTEESEEKEAKEKPNRSKPGRRASPKSSRAKQTPSRSPRDAKAAATSLLRGRSSGGKAEQSSGASKANGRKRSLKEGENEEEDSVKTVPESPLSSQSPKRKSGRSQGSQDSTNSGKPSRPRILEDVPEDKSWPLRRRSAALSGSSSNTSREQPQQKQQGPRKRR